MGGLFSKKKSRITEQDKAVLQLKQQRDKLKQYQKRIGLVLEKERECAKQLLKDGKKDKAKLLLRKKKFQEGLLAKTDNQLDNIEQLVHNIEFAQIETQVVQGLQAGNESLKKMHQLMSIEDVEKIMDETKEAVEYQREIDDILAGGLSDEDENDVLEELDAIIAQNTIQTDNVADELSLPEVPKDELSFPEVPGDELIDERSAKVKPKELVAAS